jgi:hypothetical protein
MVLVEISSDGNAGQQIYRFSDKGYVTKPTDALPNTVFAGRLKDSGRIGINAYSDGRTGGGTHLELGQVIVDNSDGKYDSILTQFFSGQLVTIYYGQQDDAPFNSTNYPVVFSGTLQSVTADFNSIIFTLRDKLYSFDKPLLTTTYAGNNVAPNGIEGGADILGKVKPLVLGKVLNITPVMVNSSLLTYQMSTDSAVALAVYDRGLALAAGTDYATLTALEAATVTAGTFVTCIALGLFRLGQNPTGTVTCDATASGSGATVGNMLNSVALKAGISASSISAADVTALNTTSTSLCGIYITDQSTVLQVMDRIAQSIGAWYAFDLTGTLRMGVLSNSFGTPVASVYDYQIQKNGLQRRAPKDSESPIFKSTFKYAKNYTVQTSDLAGAVTAVRKAALAQDFLVITVQGASNLYPLREEAVVETCILGDNDAAYECVKWHTTHSGLHVLYDIPVDITTWSKYNVKLMDTVSLYISRFGMQNGKSFKLIGYRMELSKNRVTMILWA